MDFISWAELGLSLAAVVAVFFAVTGLMMIVATELTEEGRWFLGGIVLPGAALLGALPLPSPWSWLLQLAALAAALLVPWLLVARRRDECLRPVLTGQILLLSGAGCLAVLIRIHYAHFVQ